MSDAVFRWVNGWPPALAPAMRVLSEAHTLWTFRVGLLALVIVLVIKGGHGRRAATQALIAFPIANFVCDLFKKGILDPRPCASELAGVIAYIPCGSPSGTASAHAANMAAVAAAFWVNLGWRWGGPWATLALLVGVSRIYVAAHFPHQVALGWAVGAVAGATVAAGWRAFRDRPAGPGGYRASIALRDPVRGDSPVSPEPDQHPLP